MLVVKKTHKSKTPKVRILFSGMSDILAKKTDDMNSIQNIFEEIEFSTPILNEKMSKYSSFRQLYKELVSDFTWFHQETNVNEVVFNIFGSIIIGKHPLYNYLRPKYYKELELFCEMYHFNQSYYALDSDDNPVVVVKSRDKYRSMQVLSPNRDQNEDKTSQFQKLNPDSLNDDDLAYWAYSEVTGNHLIQNVEHGKQLLKRASENSAEAKYYLSILTNDDDLLMKACEEKYSQAMVKIGTKEKLNLELIQQAVLLGNIDAFYYLGLYYFEKEEYKLAYGFFYRAASLNQSDAQWRIAMMLEKSMVSGIQDLESAEAFYLASAGQKNPIGLYHYARFEETYKDTNCNQIYKISADLGFLDAQIPVIAYDVSKKEMTLEEIFNLVDEKDSSISTELLFRIAYSLPKSKEEIASALRAKAKSQLNDNDTDKFYAGFGLSSVFQCLREMTELSADWESIMSIGIKRLSPSNKILCWAQDFPNPSIDTVFLISEETLIKTPKDAMIIRNKFTKLARQKEYANDPFFLLFYLLHIKDHHAVLDSRLEQFVEATKKKLRKMNYTPFIFIYEGQKIKENNPIGDGRIKYLFNLKKKGLKEIESKKQKRSEKRRNGINAPEDYIDEYIVADKDEILYIIKQYPQLLADAPCKFFKFSQFYEPNTSLDVTYDSIMKAAFPYTNYISIKYQQDKNVQSFPFDTIQNTPKIKIERAINIISSQIEIICTFYDADNKIQSSLKYFNLNRQYEGIIYAKERYFDGNNLVQTFNIKELKPIKLNNDDKPLEKSLILAGILKQLFIMQAIGSKHGNITKESFVLADDKISIFGCDIFGFFNYYNPETDFQNSKIALQEILPDIPQKTIDLFNNENDFITIYQTIMLDPDEYLYKDTPIDEFFDRHTPFNYHEYVDQICKIRNDCDFLLICMTIPGQDSIIQSYHIYENSTFHIALLLSFIKDSDDMCFKQIYKDNIKTICEKIQSINESELNEKDHALYTYFKRKGYFLQQEDVEYQSTISGNRMKLIEKMEIMEKEAFLDFQEQKLQNMSINVKKLIHAGDENVVNLYGVMHKYGIYNPKDKEKAEYYLSLEKIIMPFCQIGQNQRYRFLLLNEKEFSKHTLYDEYRKIYENEKNIPAEIAEIRCKRNVTEKDIQKLLSIEEMPFKIEAMFTAGLLLQSKDLQKSKELRSEAMKIYLSTEWSKFSESLVFLNGNGFVYPIFEYFKDFQNTAWNEVDFNEFINNGCSAYKKIITPWVLNFGEDFNIPEAVTLQLIEREQNDGTISVLYSDYSYWAQKPNFKENMFFMFHFAIFLKAHKYDKTPETKKFIANIIKKCADEKINPVSGYFYYKLFDSQYAEIDKNEAIEYLKKSVDGNCIEAIYAYGVDLATGNYVVQNEPAAKMYLTQIQKEYPPANAYLEAHLRRNILDFNVHNDDEISSGSVSEMTESIKSREPNEHLEMAKDVGKFMMNFKDWIPLIMSIIRIIQSCSSSIEVPKEGQNTTTTEAEENETIRKIRSFFDWATTIVQKIANSLDLDSIKNTESSILISVLFTFFFTFMIFSFNTNAFNSFKMLVACTIFIPFSFGIAAVNKTWGIVLLIIGIVLLCLSGIVAFLIRKRNVFIQNLMKKISNLNVFLKYILGLILLPLTDILLFGSYLERLIPGAAHKLVKKHEIMTAKQLKKDSFIIIIIAFVVIDLFVLSVITANTLYIIITVLLLVVLIILGILIAVLKIDIKRIRVTINEIWMYGFVLIAESIVMVIIDHLTDDEDEMNKYVKAISSIMLVIYPLILMFFFTYKLYHIWSVTHPTYFRIWIRSTISFIAHFGETVKARYFYWTVIDYAYHIIFSIASAYGGPIVNIIVTIIYIIVILLLRPFLMVSDNILTIGEPIIVCLLNILLLATNKARNAGIALGIVFLILAFVPAIVSLVWYIIKERGHEFDFLKKDMIHEYDRVEQKEGLNVVSGVSEIVGYDDYKHLYTVWPGEFTEADIPELDFKNRLIETYGKDDFILINAAALMIGYCMMYLWIGIRYLA